MTIASRAVLVTRANRAHAGLTTNQPDSQGETRTMNDYTTSFVVDQSPKQVFDAINNVRGWWGEDVEGSNQNVGDEFTYRVQDIHYSKL